jgi:hypothetical protein
MISFAKVLRVSTDDVGKLLPGGPILSQCHHPRIPGGRVARVAWQPYGQDLAWQGMQVQPTSISSKSLSDPGHHHQP